MAGNLIIMQDALDNCMQMLAHRASLFIANLATHHSCTSLVLHCHFLAFLQVFASYPFLLRKVLAPGGGEGCLGILVMGMCEC